MKKAFLSCLLVMCWICFPLSGDTGAAPKRVISLAPSLTKAAFLLERGDALVGCTTYCVRPEAAKKKEKIGTLVKFNLEKIVALQPDLVLAMEFSDKRAVDKLKSMGFRVEMFPSPKNFLHLCESFRRMGKILGREKKAAEVIEKAKAEVKDIVKRAAKYVAAQTAVGKEKIKIFWQLGAKPLFAATSGYFTSDYIRMAGAVNIAGDVKNGIYSREVVLRKNPDVIIIITMGIVGEQEKKTWENYTSIEAVKQGRILIVDSYEYCSPTPAEFVPALKKLIKYLYPEGFPVQ